MRLLLIGAGVIARTHATAAGLLGETVELLVADPSAEAREAFLAEHPGAQTFADSLEMLGLPAEPGDIVVVATPPRHHLGPALAALDSGRDVLVEKPLALTVDEAERMLAAAEAHGRVLAAASTRFRGLPHTEAVKRAWREGLVGRPYALRFQTAWARSRAGIEYQPQSRWFLDSAQAGGGVLMDWGPYDVSTLLDLLRPVRIEVRDAWLASPRTSSDPTDVVHDVESHAGAALRATLADGSTLPVVFERANHTPGEPVAVAELLGDRGALRWVPFDSAQPVRHHTEDADGEPVVVDLPRPETLPLTPYDRPLVSLHRHLRGLPSFAAVGAAVVEELRLVRALYEVAADGIPRTVEFTAPIASARGIEDLT